MSRTELAPYYDQPWYEKLVPEGAAVVAGEMPGPPVVVVDINMAEPELNITNPVQNLTVW